MFFSYRVALIVLWKSRARYAGMQTSLDSGISLLPVSIPSSGIPVMLHVDRLTILVRQLGLPLSVPLLSSGIPVTLHVDRLTIVVRQLGLPFPSSVLSSGFPVMLCLDSLTILLPH